MLLSADAAINLTDTYGLKPIHLASRHVDRYARTALLVGAGANVEALTLCTVMAKVPTTTRMPHRATGQRVSSP